MYTKVIYCLVDYLAIVDIILTYRALKKVKQEYGRLLRNALIFGIAAISANVLIAVSMNAAFAGIAYCLYFAAIDWILLYLTGFCLSYTEHERGLRILKIPAIVIMAVDSVSILLNPVFGHHFSIYENHSVSDTVFFQTKFNTAYYIHLSIDYIAVVITLFFIIYRIVKSYGLYRQKYTMIVGVLLLVVILNIAYMAFSLVLDASVIFYAVAGTLIYFCIAKYVPKKLMNDSIGMTVDDMNEGLILFDVVDQCIFANVFSKNRFGQTEETFSFTKEPLVSIKASLAENGDGYGKTAYVMTRNADGKEIEEHYQIRFNQLKDKKGRRIGSYLLIEDVTEEVSYLKQINDARNEADEANRAKSLFLANMSHEIRTPLNAVLGMNEMILREASDPQLLDYAENIRISGNSLLNLINDILDFSRIEAHKTEMIPVEYDLHKMLRECYFRFEKAVYEKQLYLDVNCDPRLPSGLIGDERHIIQVLSNILSNAVKYTKTGGINISVNADEPSDDQNITLRFAVSDTGIGIAEEDIPYLFDAFQRVNEIENATIQGTGLGLAITKELVDLMGGRICVESTVGKGSTFTVIISQKIADAAPVGPFHEKINEAMKPAYHESFRAPEAKVLIVDDVPVNLIVIRELLKKTEIQLDTADSGDEAIGKCRETKYDLILLDHRMPYKDGIETFKEISADGANTGTPVIMLTANALSGAAEEYKNIGFVDYLTKPIDSEDLEKSLAKYLPKEKVLKR
ncbi:MAG: response regulator [Lachnospiraceae bacterium]|nr:response regulator [Lachnospiraceae bacterium]